MNELRTLRLSHMSNEMKIKLAAKVGYRVVELMPNGRCYIVGVDSWCNNDFKNVDEVLKMLQSELYKLKCKVAA